MQQFKKEDNHYSRFVDAIQTSDIKYIKSIVCRKYYKDNWWEKYDDLAIKEFIKTENIKLFEIIPMSIMRGDAMIRNIAKSNTEIIFNEYHKYVDNIVLCKIYYNNNITNKIKKLCSNLESKNNINYEEIFKRPLDKLYKKINNFNYPNYEDYSIFIYDYNNNQCTKVYNGNCDMCDSFRYWFITNIRTAFNSDTENIINIGTFKKPIYRNFRVNLKDTGHYYVKKVTTISIGSSSDEKWLELYQIIMIRNYGTRRQDKLKLIDMMTMRKNTSNKLTDLKLIKNDVIKKMKEIERMEKYGY